MTNPKTMRGRGKKFFGPYARELNFDKKDWDVFLVRLGDFFEDIMKEIIGKDEKKNYLEDQPASPCAKDYRNQLRQEQRNKLTQLIIDDYKLR